MQRFVTKVLPRSGFYCAARLNPSGGFIHRFFDNVESLCNHITAMDGQGHTMYFAQASFLTNENRKQVNVQHLRSFFFDIDCGPEKPYLTQKDGAVALQEFVRAADLPMPSIVNSGNGLYAYWHLTEDVAPDKWGVVARALKHVATSLNFKIDPVRTADTASVLRPVGSHNRKNVVKDVKLLYEADELPLQRFIDLLSLAAAKQKAPMRGLTPPRSAGKGINDEFTSGIEGPEYSLLQIADRCAQIREVRDRNGDVPEPVWYGFIGLARFTLEGKDEEIILDWSSGHPDYSESATRAKILHHEESGVGPTTCVKFGGDNPQGCVGCKYADKIKSPIVLGKPDPEAIAVPKEEAELLPHRYKRTTDGLFVNDEGVLIKFYPCDLYTEKIAYDHSLGYETVTIRHRLPVTGEYKEFALRASLIHDKKQLLMTLGDNHVQVSGGESRNIMCAYIDDCMAALRSRRRLSTLYSQMGWRHDGVENVFVLGESVYRPGCEPELAGFARSLPPVARAFTTQGSLEEWRRGTSNLGLPGMEPLAFAFLAGAFGAPLLKFTGYAGAMVALVGKSGIGKTLLGEWIMSVYGDPQRLIMLKDDTRNALVSRLGVYGSLPVYIDEISNIEAQDLSDLVYRVTQGRDKARLNRNAVEKEGINSWNTIAVCSSNHSLIDKLSSYKSDASAEINRIMEIGVRAVDTFGRDTATQTLRTFRENFGVAGPVYARYLTEHQEHHLAKLDAVGRMLDERAGARPDERFWSAVASCAIYGGLIASRLGIINFSVTPIIDWLVDTISGLRSDKQELVVSETDTLGQFLDEHSVNALVTSNNSEKLCSIIREPRGRLIYRINTDTHRLFISRAEIKTWAHKKFVSYSELRRNLEDIGALVTTDKRAVLGAKTYIGGTQQPCWEIDLTCPSLGRTVVGIVKQIETGKTAVG